MKTIKILTEIINLIDSTSNLLDKLNVTVHLISCLMNPTNFPNAIDPHQDQIQPPQISEQVITMKPDQSFISRSIFKEQVNQKNLTDKTM